jgi:solute carrier family 27 fatty acid transporter 1/4
MFVGTEGRAGMAAIVDETRQIDLEKLNRDLQQRLPAYARPIFLRLLDKLDMTSE